MQAIKAIIKDGNVILDEPVNFQGEHAAIVVVLDPDPWEALIADPRPRPALTEASEAALREFLEGRTTPLEPDVMS